MKLKTNLFVAFLLIILGLNSISASGFSRNEYLTDSLFEDTPEPGDQLKEDEISVSIYATARGKFSIKATGTGREILSITVFDILGNNVYTTKMFKDTNENISLALDHFFVPGIYFMNITSGPKVISQQKFAVE